MLSLISAGDKADELATVYPRAGEPAAIRPFNVVMIGAGGFEPIYVERRRHGPLLLLLVGVLLILDLNQPPR